MHVLNSKIRLLVLLYFKWRKPMLKTSKQLGITGSIFLLVMAGFHISGIRYGSGLIDNSNAVSFVKEIFPVLFAHPSIHLLGLAALGFLAATMKEAGRKVFLVLGIIVLIDAGFAFYLAFYIPGVLLLIAATLFLTGSAIRLS